MKTEDIRKMTIDEVHAKLADTRDELMKLRFQQVTGQLTDTSRMRQVRHDIARMETIAKELVNAPVEESASEKTEKKPRAKPKATAKKAEAQEETKEEIKAEAKEKPKAKPKVKPEAKPKAKPKAKAKAEEGEA